MDGLPMIKLLLRAVHNVLYALENLGGDFLYNLDLLGSVLTLGAYPETISARLWEATQPTSPKWQRILWLLPRKALDWFVLTVIGKANHTQGAYTKYLAIKAALAAPAAS